MLGGGSNHPWRVIVLCAALSLPSIAQDAGGIVSRMLEVQKQRPFWFDNYAAMGEIPFAYDVSSHHYDFDTDGKRKFPPKVKGGYYKRAQTLIGERIPIEQAWYDRCIEQDGIRPCIKVLLEQQQERYERNRRPSAGVLAAREAMWAERRTLRQREWDEVARAFEFTATGPDTVDGRPAVVVEFKPKPGYRPPGGVPDAGYFPKIEGRIWIDEGDTEIAQMEFTLMADVGAMAGIAGEAYKGTHYEIELFRHSSGMWLPRRHRFELRKRDFFFKRHEEFESVYSNYRVFDVTSEIRFDLTPEQ